jgi:hypothetical protein
MTWDLGFAGLSLLVAMSLGFGLLAQVIAGRGKTTGWLGLIAASSFFVSGLVTSEIWFGWATEEDLQPNIDGLSFDEVLLFGLLGGIASVLITRHLAHHHGQGSSGDAYPDTRQRGKTKV